MKNRLLWAATAAAFATPTLAHPPRGTFVVHAIDVGTGLAVFVEGADFTLLYDAGSKDNSGGGTRNRVLSYLQAVRPGMTTLDHLILSHPHEDHVEMMDEVLAAYDVDHVWDSGSFNPTCGYRSFLSSVSAETGVTYHTASTRPARVATFANCSGRTGPVPASSAIPLGTSRKLGAKASMTVLHAQDTRSESDLNNASVVVRLDLGGKRLLLTGDAEAGGRAAPSTAPSPGSAEGILLARFRSKLRSDVLVVAHHGSKTSSRTEFLDAVDADHYVISSGPTKYHGVTLPDPEVEAEVDGRGELWRTDRNDAACRVSLDKTGLDGDSKPGGCDNIRLTIDSAGRITGDIHRPD